MKQKMHKGLLKRVRITGTGKIKHCRRGTSHLNSKANGRTSQQLGKDMIVPDGMARKMGRALNLRLHGPKPQG